MHRLQVSAIIPTFNSATLVKQAIESALAQTHPLQEIIVIDDGSTDDTRLVVESYPPPVRYLWQKNAGPAAARNLGLREAHTEWVAFLDADDWWLPEKTERQVAFLATEPKSILCYSGVVLVHPDGRQEPVRAFDLKAVWPQLRLNNPITPSTVIAHRATLLELGGFLETVRGTEDWEMWARLGPQAHLTCVPESLTMYRLTTGSLSSNPTGMLKNQFAIIDRTLIRDLYGFRRWLWRRRIIGNLYLSAFLTARSAGHPGAMQWLRRSLLNWPSPFFRGDRYRMLLLELLRALR